MKDPEFDIGNTVKTKDNVSWFIYDIHIPKNEDGEIIYYLENYEGLAQIKESDLELQYKGI